MTPKCKDILKKAVDSNEGLISPATMINAYAEHDQRSVEILVSQGYLERVYQFHEGIKQATYSIIFYAVTEKGLMEFASVAERLWFNFRSQTALYIGVASIIFGLVSSVISWKTMQNTIRQTSYIEMQSRSDRINQARVIQEAKERCEQFPELKESGLYYTTSGKSAPCSEVVQQYKKIDTILEKVKSLFKL